MGAAQLLAPKQVCAQLGVTMRELRAMKAAGTAPESFNVTGRTVRYLSTSVDELNRHQRDSEHHSGAPRTPTKGA